MRPNIIICTCDQLRAFEVGCYGNEIVRTPNIDRLAFDGIRFDTAVTSYPICMAARSSILSGQYGRRCTGGVSNVAFQTDTGHFAMPEYPRPGRPHLKDPTLPELLRPLGYHNAAIGKWHIHSWPDEIGFDEFVIPHVHHCHTGQSFTRNGGPEFVPDGYSTDFEADEVGRFLSNRSDSDDPFFLYYNISPPHCPLADAPDRYLSMYDPTEIPLRPNVNPDLPLDNQDSWFKVYRYDFRYYTHHLRYTESLPEGYDLRHLIAEYYGLTTWVDDTVGKLIASLETHGLAGNTIVVFTSDHGDMLGSHGRVQKGYLSEESIRIPYILRIPGFDGGRTVTEQVANLVDLMPTLLSLVGGPAAEHVHGQDLTPVLRGETEALPQDYSFIESGGDGIGIRTPTHVYGLPCSAAPGMLGPSPHYFYDLVNDPYQLDNMAGTTRDAELAKELDTRLKHWNGITPGMDR